MRKGICHHLFVVVLCLSALSTGAWAQEDVNEPWDLAEHFVPYWESVELEARLFTLSLELWRTWRMSAIDRLRAAWPVDDDFKDPLEALEALWTALPEQREAWEWRLLTPLELPSPPPPD